jgi:hypothetical protein
MMEGVLVASRAGGAFEVRVASAGAEQPASRRAIIVNGVQSLQTLDVESLSMVVQKLCFCCSEVELPNSERGREEKGRGMDQFN